MKTLYACDLDGTLLDANAQLSETSARMLHELTAEGHLITFVTARTPATIEPILAPAHPCIPGVAMTGSAIWDPLSRQYTSMQYFSPKDIAVIKSIFQKYGTTPFIYTKELDSNQLIAYKESQRLTPIEQSFVDNRAFSDLKKFHIGERYPESKADCTVLFFSFGEPDKIRAICDEIHSRTNCYSSWFPDIYNPGVAIVEVFAEGVSKANGMLKLKDMLGADRIVAFGDNLNDIPMLQAADMAVAVANAQDEVKAVADVVIGPNTADSVMHFIKDDIAKTL